jgi:hypothetical protein
MGPCVDLLSTLGPIFVKIIPQTKGLSKLALVFLGECFIAPL